VVKKKQYDLSFLDDMDFCNWLVGFTDGEGLFGLSYFTTSNTYSCEFGFTYRADDYKIYEYIGERLGLGHLCHHKDHDWIGTGGNTHKPSGGFQIRDSKDLLTVIIPIFDKFPLKSKKALEYPLWRMAVELLTQRMIFKKQNSLETYQEIMEEIRMELKDLKKGNKFNWSDPDMLLKLRFKTNKTIEL
jgi:hypothetical protein